MLQSYINIASQWKSVFSLLMLQSFKILNISIDFCMSATYLI